MISFILIFRSDNMNREQHQITQSELKCIKKEYY
jgi:hypothetical protein